MEDSAKWGLAVVAEGVRVSDGATVAPKEMLASDR